MAERAPNPRGQGLRLREALLDAASHLLATPALEQPLSLRAVARQVGVVPQSVYLHFGSKQQLVAAVVERCYAELAQAGEAAAAEAAGPRDQLRGWCLAYCRFGVERAGHYALLFETRATGQMGVPFAESPGAAVFDGLVARVQRCLDPAADAFGVATCLWLGLHGLVALRRTKPGFPWPPTESLVDRLLDGLLGPRPRGPTCGGR